MLGILKYIVILEYLDMLFGLHSSSVHYSFSTEILDALADLYFS